MGSKHNKTGHSDRVTGAGEAELGRMVRKGFLEEATLRRKDEKEPAM